jgi:hypothetical protein
VDGEGAAAAVSGCCAGSRTGRRVGVVGMVLGIGEFGDSVIEREGCLNGWVDGWMHG